MKPLKPWLAALLALGVYAGNLYADEEAITKPLAETPADTLNLPLEERGFVDAINKFDKKSLVEILGEPAKADDVRIKGTNKVVASIWVYHNINTNADGEYYQTTELDFIDDKVVQVVFMNHDGSEPDAEGQTYDVQVPPQNAQEPSI